MVVGYENTNHNVDGTVAFECELEEGDLVIPVDNIAFDGCSLSTSKKDLAQLPVRW